MAKTVTNASEIPAALCYVTTTDTFMSDWGRAEGKVNKLILPCDSYAEAKQVADYARSRSDQKQVRIRMSKPNVTAWHILWQVMERSEASAWYTKS